MTEPRTAAGRALLDPEGEWSAASWVEAPRADVLAMVLAIEAEMLAKVEEAVRGLGYIRAGGISLNRAAVLASIAALREQP